MEVTGGRAGSQRSWDEKSRHRDEMASRADERATNRQGRRRRRRLSAARRYRGEGELRASDGDFESLRPARGVRLEHHPAEVSRLEFGFRDGNESLRFRSLPFEREFPLANGDPPRRVELVGIEVSGQAS